MEQEYDLEDLIQDANYKGNRSPYEIMNHNFEVTYNRNWKLFLQSIEWDTWCKPISKIELTKILKEKEYNNHPFNKFF